jgi:hypothetical protein
VITLIISAPAVFNMTNFSLSNRFFNNLTFTSALLSTICVVIDWSLGSKKDRLEKENIIKTFDEKLEKKLQEQQEQTATIWKSLVAIQKSIQKSQSKHKEKQE